MANDCLITKLKKVVNNNKLETLGEISFYVKLINNSSHTNLANMYPKVGGQKTVTLEFPNNTITRVDGGVKVSDHICRMYSPDTYSSNNQWLGPHLSGEAASKAVVKVINKYILDVIKVVFSDTDDPIDFSYVPAAIVKVYGVLPAGQVDLFDYNSIRELDATSATIDAKKVASNLETNLILESLVFDSATSNTTVSTEDIAKGDYPLNTLRAVSFQNINGNISHLAKFNFSNFGLYNTPVVGQIEQLALGQIKRGNTTGSITCGNGCGQGGVKLGTISKVSVQNYGPDSNCILSWAPNASNNSYSDVTYSCPGKSKSVTITIDNTTGEEIQ